MARRRQIATRSAKRRSSLHNRAVVQHADVAAQASALMMCTAVSSCIPCLHLHRAPAASGSCAAGLSMVESEHSLLR